MVVEGSHLTVHVLINPIYNVVMGVNPALISVVLFLQRAWDAMLDPAIGQFSDNLRSRWGRRIPLLAAAALPLAVLFGAMWWFPRDASQSWLFGYMVAVSLLFYVAHSCFAMPLLALLLEATDDYQERARLSGVFQAFGFTFQILTQWLFPLTQLPIFPNTITGLRWVTGGVALFFLGSALLPVLLCREGNYGRLGAPPPRLRLIESLSSAVGNRHFFTLLLARSVHSFSYNIVGILAFYMNVYYVFGGNVKGAALALGIVGSSYHISAIVGSLFIFPRLARRLGKKRVFQIGGAILIAGCISKLFLYQPGHPWLQLIVISANGLSAAAINLAALSMLGDIADSDDAQTGLRREGLFASVLSWSEKAGMSLGGLLGGLLLVAIGFDAKLGAQGSQTLEWMKLSYVVVPLIGAVASMYLIRHYDLDQAHVSAIRARLEKRRGLRASTNA